MYALDLSPDLAEEGNFNLGKQWTVRVELKFGIALPNTVTVVAYAEFENVIEIDRIETSSTTLAVKHEH